MDDLSCYDWTTGSSYEHRAMARRASPEQLRRVARIYDWTLYPEEVLNWVMAQKCIDLGAALSAFFNGDPERFNYIPKRDVPEEYRAAARVLDNICLRVNSGFYLFLKGENVADERRLSRWLHYQEEDREDGQRGRWILDERILETRHQAMNLPDTVAPPDNSQNTLLHDVLSPIKQLGVNREYLKYLPGD